jgi:mRNA interferase MazF
LRRGEIWTGAGSGYAGEPRPMLIVQDDRFTETGPVTVCAFTTDPTEAPLLRLPVQADELNGLHRDSQLMIDKLLTVPRSQLREQVGRLSDEDLVRLGRMTVVFLGLAGA